MLFGLILPLHPVGVTLNPLLVFSLHLLPAGLRGVAEVPLRKDRLVLASTRRGRRRRLAREQILPKVLLKELLLPFHLLHRRHC